ncbi:MAG TPA: DUF2269 family protein [Acidimicrobiia bacterium]|nr:DUF2269 family protein [Acidimicrobiia bacterium]
MLAAVDGDAYNIVLVLHILCAIIGFGSVFLASFFYQQARAHRGSEGIAIVEAYRLVSKIATYFMVAVLLLGVALVLMSDDAFNFGDTWILLSLVVFVIALGMAGAVLEPKEKRALDLQREIETLGESSAAAQTAELVRLDRKMTIFGTALNVAVVLILVFMVFKP